MLSPILNQRNLSEDQFIADLTSLFRRRSISYGEPEDLERLASHLASDDAFRGGLFNLCTVISRMSEVELTPQQVLVLVARAAGGPRIFDTEGAIAIPPTTERAFLSGYEAWTKREPDLDAYLDRRHHEPFHAAMALSMAEGSRRTPEPYAGSVSSPRTISPNAPLDSLTLGELRQYLDEIERRVSRIEPHLDQVVPNLLPSPAHFEPLDAEAHSLREIVPVSPAPEPVGIAEPSTEFAQEPAVEASTEISTLGIAPVLVPEAGATDEDSPLAVEAIIPALEVEQETTTALAKETIVPDDEIALASDEGVAPGIRPILDAEPPPPAIRPDIEHRELFGAMYGSALATVATPEAHRLRRMRAAIAILTILLACAIACAAVLAFRSLNSQRHPAASAAPDQDPVVVVESAHDSTSPSQTTPMPPTQTTPAVLHDAHPLQTPQAVASATSHSAASTTAQNHTSTTAAAAPVIRLSAEPTPPVPTQLKMASPPSQTRLSESAIRSEPPPVSAQTAEAKLAAPAAAAPLPAPVVSMPEPASSQVSVPSTKIMAYAISPPAPLNPPAWHSSVDSTVEVVAIISKDGKVTSAQALNGAADVLPAALLAMRSARFRPYLVGGQPVEVVTTFKFLFKATDHAASYPNTRNNQ